MYWKVGDKVKFIGCDQTQINWGCNDNPNPLMKISDVFELSDVDVHTQHTKIQLVGVKGRFNSVCFELVV